jgi:hypothetical protein
LGSGPNVLKFRDMHKKSIDHVIAINNAWKVSCFWNELIYPEDFPESKLPSVVHKSKKLTSAETYVAAQNNYGGFIYGGGTMAFTAGYYALYQYRPKTIAFIGCDMMYPEEGKTHFYGDGTADPLRDDITLQSLEAKSTRLMIHAAKQGCALVNLSQDISRLTFPKISIDLLAQPPKLIDWNILAEKKALQLEKKLNYFVASGKYWEQVHLFDKVNLQKIDQLWLDCIKN